MKKNDITYEYRVFTNRLIDVESMEVGKCTSKVIKELKQKDKVDGRFFHTSDTDEWFFCWNGVLQKLNLKGNEDLNSALDEVKKLISEANSTVEDVKKTAKEAKEAADNAKTAADSANAAVESIENKADKSDVEAVSKIVEDKADKLVVDNLSQAVATKAEQSVVEELSDKIDSIKVDDFATKSDISTKQDEIKDLDIIRSGAKLGATALQLIPEEYVTETELEDKGYLTEHQDLSEYAKQEWVEQQGYLKEHQDLSKYALKSELPTVPTNISAFTNDAGYLTEHQNLSEYAKQEWVEQQGYLTSQSINGYATEDFVKSEIANAQLKGEGVDLSGYATKEDIANFVSKDEIPSTEELATKEYVASVVKGYATESWVSEQGFVTEQNIAGKQDVIENLDDIISGAEAGATALQPGALDGYVTSENVYTKAEIDALIGVATSYIKDTILA